MTEQLKTLWHLAFGDGEEAIDAFFRTAYAPERCRYLTENGRVTAALYWLDCAYRGQKQAYIYAVATHPDHRGRGLCRKLMEQTHSDLKALGYHAALLRPADSGLRRMYRKLGYKTATCVSEFSCAAGEALALREIGLEEYARLRREFLPEDGVLQEGVSLSYLAAYARFWAGEAFLLAGMVEDGAVVGVELLGDRSAAPGILGALGCTHGSFRCPGAEMPFGMFLPLSAAAEEPGYLGLVFD